MIPDSTMPLASWGQVEILGDYTRIKSNKLMGAKPPQELQETKRRLVVFADGRISGADKNVYQTVISKSDHRIGWGSNSDTANESVALIQAYQLSHGQRILKVCLEDI